ncbi:MAG: mechanosensitive ion channel family protein [Thermoplasmata archaeon]|nr:mechanosensitive ion channel family protein [Thermoplasmata archaeon]
MAKRRRSVITRLAAELLGTLAVALGLGIALALLARQFCTVCFGSNPPILFTLAEAGAVVLVGYLTARAFGRAVRTSLDEAGNVRYAGTVRLVVDIVIGTLMFLALLFVFRITDVQSILFGSAFAGIVLGLASQTVLSNMFAGLIIVFAGPFRTGDRIGLVLAPYPQIGPSYPHEATAPEIRGTVREVGLLYTVLRLDDGRTARIPNGVVYGAVVTNLSQTRYRLTRIRLTLPRSLPVAELESEIQAFAREFAVPSGVVPQPRCFVVDVTATTWDALIEVWSETPRDEPVVDGVLRRLADRGGTGKGVPAAKATKST